MRMIFRQSSPRGQGYVYSFIYEFNNRKFMAETYLEDIMMDSNIVVSLWTPSGWTDVINYFVHSRDLYAKGQRLSYFDENWTEIIGDINKIIAEII